MNWLVIVTYMAGSSWSPLVTTEQVPNAGACQALQAEVARAIVKTAASNVTGGAEISKEGDDVVIIARTSARQVARLSCAGGKEETSLRLGKSPRDPA